MLLPASNSKTVGGILLEEGSDLQAPAMAVVNDLVCRMHCHKVCLSPDAAVLARAGLSGWLGCCKMHLDRMQVCNIVSTCQPDCMLC